ncbi:beta-glucosidase BoGH3B-like, partial [Populus alba x Populus x berolinensis]
MELGDMLSPKRNAQGAKEAIENEIGIHISKCNFHTNYEINPAEKVQKRGGLKTSFSPERVATIYLCLKVKFTYKLKNRIHPLFDFSKDRKRTTYGSGNIKLIIIAKVMFLVLVSLCIPFAGKNENCRPAGSVLSGGGSAPLPEASAEDWVNMINGFQNGSLSGRLGIPMIYGIDAVHGHNNVFNATIFPHNIGLGATRQSDRKIPYGLCSMYRSLHKIQGVGQGCYECYIEDQQKFVEAMDTEDPYLVYNGGDISVNSRKRSSICWWERTDLQEALSTSSFKSPVLRTSDSLNIPHKPGLIKILSKLQSSKVWFQLFMVSLFPVGIGVKMHANRELITGFLKVTPSRSLFISGFGRGIDRITSPPHANYSYSVQAAIQAGHAAFSRHTTQSSLMILTYLVFKSNVIPMDRSLNDAVGRILLSEVHLGSGTHADNLGYQCGGWSIQWQGFSGNRDTRGTTILGAIKSTVDPSTEVVFQENPDSKFIKDNNFAYAIIVVGEPPYAETAGDSMDLTMIDPGPSVISNVCETVKCVVVVISGRPIVIEPYLSSIDALVAAWLPGTEGQGDYGFTGKLPRTWFKNVDQLPMNVGDPHYDPLFPFDFGLKTKSAPDILRRQLKPNLVNELWAGMRLQKQR